MRAASRSRASWRLRACERESAALARTTGPTRSSNRWPAAAGRGADEAPTSNCTSTRLSVRLACWPPGPPEVVARQVISESGRSRPRRTCRVSLPVHPTSVRRPGYSSGAMEHRHLGNSGLEVSALSYGNWITHGSQIEEDAADGVRARLRSTRGSPPSTRRTSTHRVRRSPCSGRALRGVRRDSIEIFTKTYWPTGPNPNNRGLSRKHIMESLHSSLERLQTDHVDLLQAHRFDYEAPLEETMRAFDDLVRQGKVHYVGVSEWTRGPDRRSAAPGRRHGVRPHRLEPAPVLAHLAGDRGRGGAAVREGGHRPDRVVAAGPGRAHRQVPARRRSRTAGRDRAPPGPRAARWAGSCATRCSSRCRPTRSCAGTPATRRRRSRWRGCCAIRTSASAIVGASRPEQIEENVKALDLELEPDFVEAIEKALAPATLFDPGFTFSPARRSEM